MNDKRMGGFIFSKEIVRLLQHVWYDMIPVEEEEEEEEGEAEKEEEKA